MPLSRYEIRSEFGLANPDLYRAAEKDDPEGLLEGVAMAGLVGIIRQLGDLAEFAAEVFHDLHEDVLAVAARGHELLVRVRQLEREAPLIESLMLTKTSYGNFIYNQGIEWHPCIYNEQNHFSQGDLPGFIRSAYEDCRSPPRLYTLDRFDGTGAGACLKRYTDPSFFKMEWASSELMKAEREQRDQKARRLKKMGQQQENEMRDAVMESHVKFSVPDEVDKVETSSCHSQFSYSSNRSEQEFPDTLKDENGDMLTASSSIFSGQDGQLWNGIIVENSASAKVSLSPPNLQQEISDADSKKDSDQLDKALECSMKDADVAAGDSASDTENFMDAETMDSEVEADVETKESLEAVVFKSRPENEHCLSMPENDHSLNMPEIEIPGSQLFEDRLREITQEQVLDESVKHIIEETGRGDDSSRKDLMPGDLSKADWVFLNEDGVTAAPRQDDSPRLSVTHTDANKDGSNIDIMLEDLSEADKGSFNEDATADSPRQDNLLVNRLYVANIGANDFSISNGTAAQSPSSAEDASAGNSKVLSTDLSLCESAKEGMNSLSDETSSNECDVLSPISQEKIQSGTKEEGVMPPLCLEEIPSEVNDVCVASTVSQELVVKVDESTVVSPEEPLQSLKSPPQLEETEDSGLSEPLEANVNSESLGGTTLAQFSQLQEPAASESQNQSSAGIEVVSTRKRWQINKLFDNVILAPDLAADNSQASESEHGESPLRPSLHSSPSASIQPMKWTIGLSNFYNSDDEIDGLQGSLGSLSSSSSALSSPRPSILATTLDGLNLGVKQMPISVSQRSATSSPSCSPLLGITDMVHERDIAVQMLTEGVMPTAEKPAHASIISSSAAAQQCFDSLPSLGLKTKPPASEILASPAADVSTLDTFPPPPPLPPLAWRMSRKSQGFVAGASDSPNAATQILQKNQVELGVSAPQGSDPLIAVSSNFSSTDGKQMLQDSVEGIQHETLLLDRKTLNNTEGSTTSDSTARAAAAQSLPVSTPTKWDVSSLADASLHGKFPCIISSHVLSGSLPQTVNTSARFDENRLEPETKRSGVDEVWQLSGRDSQAKSKSGNFSSEATTSHDSNMFKRRSKWALTESSDDREVLLEQIRNKSFSLRTSGTEKVAGSQPVVNINVAAILEKANAIRQVGFKAQQKEK